MNADTPEDDPLVRFYDTDHPWPGDPLFEQAAAEPNTSFVAHDIGFVRDVAARTNGPILDYCCGSGRLSVPLARDGREVVGLDINSGLLERLRTRLEAEEPGVAARYTAVRTDVRRYSHDEKAAMVFCGFNSLSVISDLDGQAETLAGMRDNLRSGGLLLLDLPNPFHGRIFGNTSPTISMVRRHADTGVNYIRFIFSHPFDPAQTQKTGGWYEEIGPGGTVRRHVYTTTFRFIFPVELTLMLEKAGFEPIERFGNFDRSAFEITSPKMLVIAQAR